jgi:DNA helicase-2/ATP-dependent DNA helicase PcrA
MTNLGAAEIRRRFDTLRRGTARNGPTPTEKASLDFAASPSFSGAVKVLEAWCAEPAVRSHRPAILYAAIKALRLAASGTCNLQQSVIRVREEARSKGRPLPRRAVGSTLLLKGLEAEVAVILDASNLNAANLYVAMTRGSMSLVVCSPNPVLQNAPAR